MGDDWRRIYLQLVEEIGAAKEHLTDWELNFVEAVSDLLNRRLALSDKQRTTLEDIHTKITQHLNEQL